MSTIGNNSGISNITQIDISSMDLETALMTVQQQRTSLLDTQLQAQIKEVQGRNEQIAKLNTALDGLNSFMTQMDGTGADAKPKDWSPQKVADYEVPLNDALRDAGVTDLGFEGNGQRSRIVDGQKQPFTTVGASGCDLVGTEITAAGNIANGGTTRGKIEAAITKIKGLIDGQSNNQQMDMLRLQSMSNKRNEAFDTMTNFIKKMQDSRSSIIGNMR